MSGRKLLLIPSLLIFLLVVAMFIRRYSVTSSPVEVQVLQKGSDLAVGIDESRTRARGYLYQYVLFPKRTNWEVAHIWTILRSDGYKIHYYRAVLEGGCNLFPLKQDVYIMCSVSEASKRSSAKTIYRLSDTALVKVSDTIPEVGFEQIAETQGWSRQINYLPSRDTTNVYAVNDGSLSIKTTGSHTQVELKTTGQREWSKDFETESRFVGKDVFSGWFL